MAYLVLQPRQDYLEPGEIVYRLHQAFSEVDIDSNTGNRFLADRIRVLTKVRDSRQDPPACLTRLINKLKELQSRCMIVRVKSRSEGTPIQVTLVPNEPALIACNDETPPAGFWQGVIDFAAAIDYEIEKPSVPAQPSRPAGKQQLAWSVNRLQQAIARIARGAKHQWHAAWACCSAFVS